jgi:hypothetical protein
MGNGFAVFEAFVKKTVEEDETMPPTSTIPGVRVSVSTVQEKDIQWILALPDQLNTLIALRQFDQALALVDNRNYHIIIIHNF